MKVIEYNGEELKIRVFRTSIEKWFCIFLIIGTVIYNYMEIFLWSKDEILEHFSKKHNTSYVWGYKTNKGKFICMTCGQIFNARIRDYNIVSCNNGDCRRFEETRPVYERKFNINGEIDKKESIFYNVWFRERYATRRLEG